MDTLHDPPGIPADPRREARIRAVREAEGEIEPWYAGGDAEPWPPQAA